MKADDYINEFINKEKQTEPNPFLSTRIMARIEAPVARRVHLWQSFAVAASFGIVVFMGIQLGGFYSNNSEIRLQFI